MSILRTTQPLAGFALAWRWHDGGPHPLPPAALARLRALPAAAVYLSWEPELALRGCWSVFVQHWPAFCQGGSDDLVVFPASRRWAVFHRHDGRLQFGLRHGLQPSFRPA